MWIARSRGSMAARTDDDICIREFRAITCVIKVEVAEDDRID
jgi:hypothetical protein